MAVVIGSARGNEWGGASGGAAGDQKQTSKPDYKGEVSRESWYLHSKGWVLVRAKSADVRERIATDMEYACDNAYIGYDQPNNQSLWNVVKPLGFNCSKVTTKCSTDCARLVRVCVWYGGVNVPDFYTATLAATLKATGAFDVYTSDKYCRSSEYLMRGDILVTKSKGHTVVVLSNGSKVQPEPTPSPDYSAAVEDGQEWLDDYYGSTLTKYLGFRLAVDGEYHEQTRQGCVCVWKDLANRKYGASLNPSNANFFESSKAAAQKMKVKHGDDGTLPVIAKLILAGKKYYSGKMDTVFSDAAVVALKNYQKAKGLKVSGEVDADTWYRLFN